MVAQDQGRSVFCGDQQAIQRVATSHPCSTEEVELLPVNRQKIGIDLGLKGRADYRRRPDGSESEVYRNTETKLARAQRLLSRKQKGSKNRAKAEQQVARLHAQIADSRKDWSHKLTTQLIHETKSCRREFGSQEHGQESLFGEGHPRCGLVGLVRQLGTRRAGTDGRLCR